MTGMLTLILLFLSLCLLLTLDIFLIFAASRRRIKRTELKKTPEQGASFVIKDDDQPVSGELIKDIKKMKQTPGGSQKTIEDIHGVDYVGIGAYDIGFRSEIGGRQSQQDVVKCGLLPDNGKENRRAAAILCDGMGGTNGGDIASRTCSDGIYKSICELSGQPSEAVPKSLLEFVNSMDQAVFELKDSSGVQLRAGTTLIAAVFYGPNLYWVSVGDSRMYIIRGEQIMQMTVDHIYLNKLMSKVQNGDLTYEDAINDRQRDSLTSYIGCGSLSDIDCNGVPFGLEPGDVIVICSDGLYRSLSETEIRLTVGEHPENMDSAAEGLVGRAIGKGNPDQDNTSVILIRYL